VIARAEYVELGGHVPGIPDETVVRAGNQERVEPPILEQVVARAYLLTGEHWWVARGLAAIAWLAGGAALFALGRRMRSWTCGFVAAAFFLLDPFAVIASTSFQPDAFMVALLTATWLAALRYGEEPGPRRAWVAVGFGAGALLVKGVAAFLVVVPLLAVHVSSIGWRDAMRSRRTWLLALGPLAPTAAYYAGRALLEGDVAHQVGGRFFADLPTRSSFWLAVTDNIDAVVGFLPFAVGIVGLLVLARGPAARGLSIGLVTGYGAFIVVFNYHHATHDYYLLPLVPVVALGLGMVVDRVAALTERRSTAAMLDVAQRFERLPPDTEWFVAAWAEELALQPELRAILEQYPVHAESEGYTVYDLRTSSDAPRARALTGE